MHPWTIPDSSSTCTYGHRQGHPHQSCEIRRYIRERWGLSESYLLKDVDAISYGLALQHQTSSIDENLSSVGNKWPYLKEAASRFSRTALLTDEHQDSFTVGPVKPCMRPTPLPCAFETLEATESVWAPWRVPLSLQSWLLSSTCCHSCAI